MKLRTYMAEVNLNNIEFGKKVDASPGYISLLRQEKILPGPKMARNIERETEGQVKFDLSEKIDGRRRSA